jgi:hypothetical protein
MALVSLDECHSPEAVPPEFKKPIWMREGLSPQRGMGWNYFMAEAKPAPRISRLVPTNGLRGSWPDWYR